MELSDWLKFMLLSGGRRLSPDNAGDRQRKEQVEKKDDEQNRFATDYIIDNVIHTTIKVERK